MYVRNLGENNYEIKWIDINFNSGGDSIIDDVRRGLLCFKFYWWDFSIGI